MTLVPSLGVGSSTLPSVLARRWSHRSRFAPFSQFWKMKIIPSIRNGESLLACPTPSSPASDIRASLVPRTNLRSRCTVWDRGTALSVSRCSWWSSVSRMSRRTKSWAAPPPYGQFSRGCVTKKSFGESNTYVTFSIFTHTCVYAWTRENGFTKNDGGLEAKLGWTNPIQN